MQLESPHTGAQPAAERTAFKLALTGLAAASVEWYDFFLYGTAAALVFPTVFFPATLPPFIALLASFSSFTVGFLARPLGSVLFGHLGDRAGRKVALTVALLTMGVATTLIGCLPSYHAAGIFSPLALVLLRFAQGLAVGGQWGGAMLLATENAPKARRGLYGSIAQAGVPAGVVLANLAFLIANAITSPADFLAYGWRIPFLVSVALVGLAFFIHFRVAETLAFSQLQQARSRSIEQRSPVLQALRLYPQTILLAAGAFMATNVAFYVLITYIVAYGTSAGGLHLPRSTLLGAVLIANGTMTPMLFFAGSLSDRYGRRQIFTTGVVLIGVFAFVLFPLIDTRSFLWITFAMLVGQSIQALTYGPLAALFAELFATRVRYSAASVAYQLGAIAGGGFAPLIATALYAGYHSNVPVSCYIAFICLISLICVRALKETYRTELDQSPSATVSR